MTTQQVEHLASGKYLSLTTFRKDGTPVATPVWVARDGHELVVITDATSGKAKRIRNNSTVQLAPCDMRGRITGEVTGGTACLTDSTGTTYIAKQIQRKYGLAYSIIRLFERLRGGGSESVGIRIKPRLDTSAS